MPTKKKQNVKKKNVKKKQNVKKNSNKFGFLIDKGQLGVFSPEMNEYECNINNLGRIKIIFSN